MLSDRLKKARKLKGLTQEDLAKLVSTKKTTISNYETGYSTPSNEMLKDLANILGTSTDWLLGRDEFLIKDEANLYNYKIDTSVSDELMDLLNKLNSIPEKKRTEIIKEAADYVEFLKSKSKL